MNAPAHVVLTALNSQYIHSSLAPWCLAAGMKAFCRLPAEISVIEGTVNEHAEACALRIAEARPDIVGFSCYIWNIDFSLQVARMLKSRLPDLVTVFGGPEVSYRPADILEHHPSVDFVLSGEGERPFALLAEALLGGLSTEDIPGLSLRSSGNILSRPPFMTREEPPSPYSAEYFAALGGRMAYFETSRGCPFSCAFCLSGREGSVRFFGLERVKSEMLALACSGTRTIKLVDRTFNANPERARELFRFIIENYGGRIPCGVCFHFEVAGDLFDEETLALLETAPRASMQFEIGLQSFNPETLAAVNRRTNVELLKANASRLISCGRAHVHIDLIAGLPHEGRASFIQSFNIAYSLHPQMLQLGFLKLLYGAPMREHPEFFPCSFSAEPPYEVLSTPWFSKEELRRLHATEDALLRLYNSGRFRRTLSYLLENLNLTPFSLFESFGDYAFEHGSSGISLDAYTGLAYEFFCAQGADPSALRDCMTRDRLAANPSGTLPPALIIRDPMLKKLRLILEHASDTRAKKSVKRGLAILYSENRAVYVDYDDRNPVTGEYKLRYVPLP